MLFGHSLSLLPAAPELSDTAGPCYYNHLLQLYYNFKTTSINFLHIYEQLKSSWNQLEPALFCLLRSVTMQRWRSTR